MDSYIIAEDMSYITAWGKLPMCAAIDKVYKMGYEIDFDSEYTGTIGNTQIKLMLKPKAKTDPREKKIRAILLSILKEKNPKLDARSCKTVDNCLAKFEDVIDDDIED